MDMVQCAAVILKISNNIYTRILTVQQFKNALKPFCVISQDIQVTFEPTKVWEEHCGQNTAML